MPLVLNLRHTHILQSSLAAAAVALAVTAMPAPLPAQVAAGVARPARLEATTAVEAARTEFWSGVEDLTNAFPNRGTAHIKRAVDLDPAFGLARVLHGINAAGLTTAQRNEEIARGVADAAKASTGELMVALAYRENFRQNPVEARAILMSAGVLLPGEPLVAYQRAVWAANVPGGTQTDAIPSLKQVIERFPEYGPAYNTLAYAQWEAGVRNDALQTAMTYMQKATAQPKPHDTYAELVQWDGRYDEAIGHYKKAIEVDPTFLGGTYGLSEVYTLQGKGEMGRSALTAAMPNTTTPAQRVAIHNRIANSYLLEGNPKAAMTALGTVIEEAQKGQLTGSVAGAHIALANIEAAFGDPKNIQTHIGHINALPPPPPGPTPPSPAGRFAGNGTTFAISGQPVQARVYLDSLTRYATTATPSPILTSQVRGTTGWVLYSEGKFAEALAEFRQANVQNPSVRAGMALTLFKLGNVVEARSMRDELVNDRNLNLANFGNVLARRLVKQRII